jgi:Flp pilus assembly protein TadD
MALADCNHVLDRLPNEPNVLEARGLAFLRMGQFTDAIEDFDGALTAQPKRTTSLYLRGIAKLHANDAAGGHADILAARSADPGIAVNLAFSGVLPR